MLCPLVGQFRRHACRDEPGADGVDADVRGAGEREAEGAHEAHYAVFACLWGRVSELMGAGEGGRAGGLGRRAFLGIL